jgi:hypothetical protein
MPIQIDGYNLENYWFSLEEWLYWDARIVEKVIDSENYINAINLFRKEFNLISQKLCFISQCYFDFLNQSYLVEKLSDNSERIFFLFHICENLPVGLIFDDNDFSNYKSIEWIENACFMYLQSCNNSVWYVSKISLLCSALEALAWKVEKEDEKTWRTYTTYDRKVMKKILWGSYMDKIFWDDWLRHKVQHWDYIHKYKDENFVDLIYKKILEFFNKSYSLNLDTDIMSPQRHFFENKSFLKCFLKPSNISQKIDLRDIPEDIENRINKKESIFIYENRSSEWY